LRIFKHLVDRVDLAGEVTQSRGAKLTVHSYRNDVSGGHVLIGADGEGSADRAVEIRALLIGHELHGQRAFVSHIAVRWFELHDFEGRSTNLLLLTCLECSGAGRVGQEDALQCKRENSARESSAAITPVDH